jgi:membrane associated rhomboid family serine protease
MHAWGSRLQTLSNWSSLEIGGSSPISHHAKSAANITGNKGTGLGVIPAVTNFLVLVLVFLGVAMYFMTPVERGRLLRVIAAALKQARETLSLERLHSDPFFDVLRARTPRVIAMPLLVVLSAAIFIFFDSPVLDLLVSAVCLWQIGLILERLVGPSAFAMVYVASGMAGGIANIAASSGGTSISASEPVLGMYGLLLATSIWSMIHQSSLTIPLSVTKQIAPVAAMFVVYKLSTTGLVNIVAFAALACGIVGGLVAGRNLHQAAPQLRRLATAMAMVVAVVTLYSGIALQRPLNQAMDIRPEIDKVMFVETRTAELYEKEVDRFRRGRINSAALADVIHTSIVPELVLAAGRLRALPDVPPEQRQLIASAETFLQLRDESWRMRAAALLKSDMHALRQADTKERASREAFHRLTTPLPADSSGQPSS